MKNKISIIMRKTFIDNFSILKTYSYIVLILLISYFLVFKSRYLRSDISLLDLQSQLASNYFIMGIFLIVGIPYLLYLIFLSAGVISKEIDKGTFLLIFSRPIKRMDVLLGKFLGIFIYTLLINAYILFTLPSLGVLFLGLSKSTLFLLYKVSIVLFLYSIFITLFMLSLAFVLSSKFKKIALTSIVLFIIVLGIFVMPMVMGNVSNEKTYTNSFASLGVNILEGFNLDLYSQSKQNFGQFTGVYEARGESSNLYTYELQEPARIKNMPSWLSIILIIFLSVALFLLSYFLIKRKEIY